MNAISIKDLVKTYPNVEALKGVSLEIKKGEFFALLGPNGAGKTTLIQILTGLCNKTSGEVSLFNKDVYQADWSGSLGLLYQGLFDGRDDDTAGLAVTTSHASSKYRDSQLILGNTTDSSETVIEITYRAQLQPWLSVQPMVQRIINPNMDTVLRDAWVVGMRLEVAF